MSKKKSQPWTIRYAREVLAQIEQSGKSDTEVARELGVTPSRIWAWRHRLRDKMQPATAAPPAFVEVAVTHKQPQPFAVHTRNGRMVTVWPGFDAGELGRLLAVVEKSPC